MKINKNPEDNYKIEEAIKFLVLSVEKTGTNPKPVITHSIRVAFRLDFYGYGMDVILAALLHDLLEDTVTSLEEIEDKFGKTVSELVSASTFNKEIEDKEERYKTSFDKALQSGRNALVIRAADLLDNSFYYSLVDDQKVYNHLLGKLSYFLKTAKNKIGKEKIYKDLDGRLKILKKK